ncbi:hypothetical protein ACQ4LE_007701 [Meloidogyne hapla]|uniref:DM domain-containing protein n=1 Tax=Meloidogyne hapla TaxID=6305 RepID=A0A1I8C051_MELHA
MSEDRKIIEHDGFEYYKEEGQWYQMSSFFRDNFAIKEDKVPDIVKSQWNELMSEQREKSQEVDENVEETSIAEESELPKSQPSKILSKKSVKSKKNTSISPLDPRLARERDHSMPPLKKAASSVNFSSTSSRTFEVSRTVETVEKGGFTPIVVTDSLQLIRPLRAELKYKMRTNAAELEKRMEIRKNIINNSDDRIKPYEPKKKNSEESMANRNESRRNLTVIAEQLVSKLERIKMKRKLLVNRKQGEEEFNPLIKIPRVGNFFEIERLSDVAAANNVTVLNLDKFICATDKRKIIYNESGVCIFCDVHGVRQLIERHVNDRDCPFFFCTCANCYLVGKLGAMGRFIENK